MMRTAEGASPDVCPREPDIFPILCHWTVAPQR